MQTIERSEAGPVVTVTLSAPPHNFIDTDLVRRLADALEDLDRTPSCRVVRLVTEGRAFCVGADFNRKDGDGRDETSRDPAPLYAQAMRLFATTKPIVASIQGAAIGAGLGLALVADFRVAAPEARFSAAFTRLGFHPGFGLSATLPRLVGEQHAALLFYTGRRIDGAEALRIGLVDALVPLATIDARSRALADEIAGPSPAAVRSIRATLRLGLADRIRVANARECEIQRGQFASDDFREGVAAMAERRPPVFRDE